MGEIDDLQVRFGRARPPDVGGVVDGVRLDELDDEIQEIVRTYSELGERIHPARVARLGLALADLSRVMPLIDPSPARDYFVMVESLARGALSALSLREKHEC